MSTPPQHPVRIVVTDDLHRSRLTVFFRFFLAIPHYLWAGLIGQAVAIAVFVNWFVLLVKAQTPDGLHKFIAGYLRYLTHLEAYWLIAANPYPPFFLLGDTHRGYPVDLHIDPPERQNRWKVFFRLFLAFPAILLSSTLFFGGPRYSTYAGGLALLVSFLAWFVAVIKGRLPRGMRDLLVYCIGYAGQLGAYLFLVTDRYPYAGPEAFVGGGVAAGEPEGPLQWALETVRNEGELAVLTLVTHDAAGELAGRRAVRIPAASAVGLTIGAPVPDEVLGVHAALPAAPAAPPPAEPTEHPVSVSVSDDLRRSRVLTFFRLPLAIPHLVWLILWSIVAWLTLILAWLCALVTGRVPSAFHRFLSRFVRYQAHLISFIYLVGNPFPGFVGKPGTYPVDLELPAPEKQHRAVTFFRFWLAIPAFFIAAGLYGALGIAAVLGWFVSLFLGRMPAGLRGLGGFAIRYGSQLNAYLMLLTPRYPDSGPKPDPASP